MTKEKRGIDEEGLKFIIYKELLRSIKGVAPKESGQRTRGVCKISLITLCTGQSPFLG